MAAGIHAGHRDRMRKKLLSFGSDIFNDHELLEMLLYSVIPYKNTNPVAIELIKRFSGLGGVLAASREELMTVDGVGERVADLILSVGRVEISDELFNEHKEALCFDDYEKTGRYLVDYFDGAEDYKTVLLLLDNSMGFIDILTVTDTDYCSAAVKAQKFLDAALSCVASVAIVAHNHPFGPCVPSIGDLETNSMIFSAFASAGILLIEHFLIIGKGYVGIMDISKGSFSDSSAVKRFAMGKEVDK